MCYSPEKHNDDNLNLYHRFKTTVVAPCVTVSDCSTLCWQRLWIEDKVRQFVSTSTSESVTIILDMHTQYHCISNKNC